MWVSGVGVSAHKSFRDQESHHPLNLLCLPAEKGKEHRGPWGQPCRDRLGNVAVTLPTFCWPEFLHVAAPSCKGVWEKQCGYVSRGKKKKKKDDRETHNGLCHMWNYLQRRRKKGIQDRGNFRNVHTRIWAGKQKPL